MLVHELLGGALRNHPDRVAVRDRSASLTYRELDLAALRVARGLRDAGIGRGDRVVVALGSCAQAVAAILGASRAGAAFVVVDPGAPAATVEHILADCTPAAIVVGDDPPPLPSGTGQRWRVLRCDDLLADGAEEGVLPRPISGDLACLIYTSGSTGRPKGVMSCHSNVTFATAAIARRLGLSGGAVIACVLPLTFDYGLYQVFLALRAEATVVLGAGADAGPGLVGFLRWSGADVLPIVPSMAGLLRRLARRERDELPPVRTITSTGERLPPAIVTALAGCFPEARIYPMYGLTECKRVSILTPEELERRPDSVGRPLDDTECLAIDPLTRRELPAGEVGELVVRGPHVMPGYWRSPEATAARYRPWGPSGERALFTGDLGTRDAEGFVYFHGRSDGIVKMNGLRVGLGEIEAAATSIEGVETAAALPPAQGRPVTLVVATSLAADAVRAALARRLEAFKVPEAIEVVGSLPLTPHGKVDRGWIAGRLEGAAA